MFALLGVIVWRTTVTWDHTKATGTQLQADITADAQEGAQDMLNCLSRAPQPGSGQTGNYTALASLPSELRGHVNNTVLAVLSRTYTFDNGQTIIPPEKMVQLGYLDRELQLHYKLDKLHRTGIVSYTTYCYTTGSRAHLALTTAHADALRFSDWRKGGFFIAAVARQSMPDYRLRVQRYNFDGHAEFSALTGESALDLLLWPIPVNPQALPLPQPSPSATASPRPPVHV